MKTSLKSDRRQEIIAYLLLILTMVIWGGTWPLGRWLVSVEVGGATIPPFMIAVIRYFLAIVCFLLILKFKEGIMNWQFAKENWKILTVMGLLSVTIYQTGYLLGEIFASTLQKKLLEISEDDYIWKKQAAKFLKDKIFFVGSKYRWDKLIKHVTDENFSSDAWIEECNK